MPGPPLRFEYLDPTLLLSGPHFERVCAFIDLVHGWDNLGWHYLVDLCWLDRQLADLTPGSHVLDACGGRGPAQYLLLECGFDVTNVDLAAQPPTPFERRRYQARYQELASHRPTSYSDHIADPAGRRLLRFVKTWPGAAWLRRRLLPLARDARQRLRTGPLAGGRDAFRERFGLGARPVGRLRLVRGNLAALPELPDATFEAVVSLSGLEHVPLAQLKPGLDELARLVRSGGTWALTTSGTEHEVGWFHEGAQGQCFSAADMQAVFGAAPAGGPDAATVLQAYRDNDFLARRLAPVYARSDRNGMPWGRWNPSYVPVGVFSDPPMPG